MPAMLSSRASFLAACAVVLGGGMAASPVTNTSTGYPSIREASVTLPAPKHGTKAPTSPELRAAWLRVRSSRAARRRFGGLGWSVAHDRRMARKRRNVLKARRAKRG